jgi:hypothetical protein
MAFVERTIGSGQESIGDEPKRLSDFLRESDDELLMEINLKSKFRDTSFNSVSGLNRLSRFLWFGRRGKTKKEEETKKEKVEKGDPVQYFSPELCNLSGNFICLNIKFNPK